MIYLASNSPRRSELLTRIGVAYTVLMPEGMVEAVDETPLTKELPLDYAVRLAQAKALAGWQRLEQTHLPRHPVLAADTTVAVGPRILGKPADADAAREMLRLLSGQVHEVITAVAMIHPPAFECRTSVTRVWFRALSAEDIEAFVGTGEYLDKAGGYGIQGFAARFIARIDGSPSGVMGLPLFETDQLLSMFGRGIQ
ncbi:MAG: septum formation inhibitor Maf [Betaproteobacteria bacterium]|nr:septum formation inhibitor Maf [Betaproteobacteria bacterium]MDE2622075.1 septum formation inhibitor Maf [Betaproteobacteria bacterium]